MISKFRGAVTAAVATMAAVAGLSGQAIAAPPTFSEFAVLTGQSKPTGITAGPDGALWFTEFNGKKIGRITTSGERTEFSLPTASGPEGITAGPDGALWFADKTADKIGRITTSGELTQYNLLANSRPEGIALGPDGAVWFTEYTGNAIGRIAPDGTIAKYTITPGGVHPRGITAGPDGAMWFAEDTGNAIGRIAVDTKKIDQFPLPATYGGPRDIAAGPDGALWFTEGTTSRIGRITTAGQFTGSFKIPTPGSGPTDIVAGPDGAMWFTGMSSHKIGRVTMAGGITEYATPTGTSAPHGIAAGPDGALWFAESGLTANMIGRITPPTPDPTVPGTTPGTPVAPATPPAAAVDVVAPAMKVTQKTLVLGKTGSVAVKVVCPAGERSCAGTARLYRATPKKLLGKRSFKIAGGRSVTLRIRISQKDQATLKRLRRMRAKLTVNAVDAAGNHKRTRKTLTLRVR